MQSGGQCVSAGGNPQGAAQLRKAAGWLLLSCVRVRVRAMVRVRVRVRVRLRAAPAVHSAG